MKIYKFRYSSVTTEIKVKIGKIKREKGIILTVGIVNFWIDGNRNYINE